MKSVCALGVLLAAVCGGAAHADIIRFKFAGTIDEISGPVIAPIQVGDSFTFAYNFDTTTPDSDPAPNFGQYNGTIILFEGEAGSFTFKLQSGDISVLDNGFAGDTYHAQAQGPINLYTLNLGDFGFGALTGDELPDDLPFALFDNKRFTIRGDVGPTFWEAGGTVVDFSRTVISSCYPDCNDSGNLTVADFGCFQGKYVLGDMYADCNASGTLTVADFGCFQGAYVLGCP
ncbi:MAG: hypothetical protein ACKVU4_04600 [Phycisphaerales bacterium]